jgi:hypothetical protein
LLACRTVGVAVLVTIIDQLNTLKRRFEAETHDAVVHMLSLQASVTVPLSQLPAPSSYGIQMPAQKDELFNAH